MSRKYSQSDIDFIIANYPYMLNKDIASHVGNTEIAIRKFGHRRGLKKAKEHLSKVRAKIGAVDYIVFEDGKQVFKGIGLDAASFCSCASSSLTYSAQRGSLLKGRYMVAYADDAKSINEIMNKGMRIVTETMDWPLWFFKAGIAPEYAKFYDGRGKHH